MISLETSHFVEDTSLGYHRSLTPFEAGKALTLDTSYRLAHLPLVNPTHADVIASVEGKPYAMGIHPRIHSLVLPIPPDALEASESYRELQQTLRSSPLAGKLAWDIIPKRRNLLHATICGSLGVGDRPPAISAETGNALKRVGPVEVELRGFFSGNINTGRFYLKLYPEERNGHNRIQLVQQAFGRPPTDLYLVGLHNLTDHLDPAETAWLAQMIHEWWDRPILRFTARELWLLSSPDDLVLDGRIEERFDLV